MRATATTRGRNDGRKRPACHPHNGGFRMQGRTGRSRRAVRRANPNAQSRMKGRIDRQPEGPSGIAKSRQECAIVQGRRMPALRRRTRMRQENRGVAAWRCLNTAAETAEARSPEAVGRPRSGAQAHREPEQWVQGSIKTRAESLSATPLRKTRQ